ncbi:MAG: hypothetical protein ACFFDY_05220 [Candidatus Thorarchaeota archaeon]
MVRIYLLVLKIINIAIFFWLFLIFLNSIFHFNEVITTADNELVILAFFGAIRNIFSYIIFGGGMIIAFACAYLLGFYDMDFMFNFIDVFFRRYLTSWFSFDVEHIQELLGNDTFQLQDLRLAHIPTLIMGETEVLFNDLYLFIFQVLIVVSIIYAIRAFYSNNPKHSLVAVGAIILMLIIPLMVEGLRSMMSLINIHITYLDEMVNPIDPSLDQIPLDDFFAFMASPVIFFAIISYIYLEIAFQINYTNTVTKPSLERSDRLEAQLDILSRESYFITANIDKIKQEAKEKLQEMESEQKEGIAIGKFFAKTGKRFSYVKEMIEKKKLEEEEKKLVTAASKTRRLGRYVERLFREDSEARDTLTASSSSPRSRNLLTSTLFNFTYRLGLLLIISFIIIHPHWFLGSILHLPPAISESVAIYSPEVIIIILGPIMLLFPVISKLISFIKHRNLIIRLQQEGRIKEILASVGDYVKKEELETPIEEEAKEVATEST